MNCIYCSEETAIPESGPRPTVVYLYIRERGETGKQGWAKVGAIHTACIERIHAEVARGQ